RARGRVLERLASQHGPNGIAQENKGLPLPLHGSLTFDHVNFAYPSRCDIPILKDISFHVDAGKKLALVGPSGTGKSTIASLILQFYTPTSGTIAYDGKDSTAYSLTDIRNQVAIVPQDVLLFGGTIRENIGYGRLDANAEDIIE